MTDYIVSLTIFIGLFSIFSLGLNLQWGVAGLINFGHVAFMTVGAYATVLLSSQGIPLPIAVVLGGLLAALLGLIIGLSTLRLREDYLSIVTIGVSELLRLIALNEEWLTKGSFGVQNYPIPLANFQPNLVGKVILIAIWSGLGIFVLRYLWVKLQPLAGKKSLPRVIWGIMAGALILLVYINGNIALYNYDSKAGLMLVTLICLTLIYVVLEFLTRSPWGRVLKAIREDEEVSKALGKNVFWYKIQALMLGGAIAGVAGSFYAWQLTTVYPSNFEPIVTFNAWTMVVLGGAGNNAGVILGALIFWLYDSVTRFIPSVGFIGSAQLEAMRIMLIGVILMSLMVWRPQGILGKKEELTLGR